MRAHQIMTRQVITVATGASIVDAANIMLDKHISGLPVVDKAGKLVGIVSQGDFIRRAEIGTERKYGRWLKYLVGPGREASDFVRERGRKVGEIMTPDPCTVTEDATLEDIVELMERNNVKRLPVVREDHLVGIVTRSNLLQAVAGLTRDVPDPTANDDHIRNHSQVSVAIVLESSLPIHQPQTVAVEEHIVRLEQVVMSRRQIRIETRVSRGHLLVASEKFHGLVFRQNSRRPELLEESVVGRSFV